MPVPGPPALIRQNRQQTPVVESSLNKYIASWPSLTPLPKTRLLQVVPNSQEGVVFIYLRFVYQINSHSVCAILAYILYIFGFIISPIENMVSFGIRHIYCKTALHFSWFTLVFISTPFLSWTLLTFLFCALVFCRHYCTGNETGVCPFDFYNYFFYLYKRHDDAGFASIGLIKRFYACGYVNYLCVM